MTRFSPLPSRRSGRIVLAVGAAAALAGVATGVATASPSGTASPSAASTIAPRPPKATSLITNVRGNVQAWLTTADDTHAPLLCAGPAYGSDPWCGVLGEEPVLVVHDRIDKVVIGVVPANATQVRVAWDGGGEASAKVGAPSHGLRVYGVDVAALGDGAAPGTGAISGAITVTASGSNGQRVLVRTAVPAASMTALAPTDDEADAVPLYKAATNEDTARTVDGLGVWRADGRTCVGRVGDMTDDGRFIAGEEADPEATMRWWPQYCSDPVTDLSNPWFLNWFGPQQGSSKYALLLLPQATKRVGIAPATALRLLGIGEDKLTLVDVGHPSAKLNVRTAKETVYSGPISKLLVDGLAGVSPLRIAG